MATRNDTQPSLTLAAKPRRLSSLMSDFVYLGRMLSHGLAGLAEQRVPGASISPARHYGEDLSTRMTRGCEPQQFKGRPAEQNHMPRPAPSRTASTPATSNVQN